MAEIVCLAKCGLFKVSHITGTSQTGNPYEFYSLERSYQDLAQKWQSERISLRPAEVLAVAGLLAVAGKHIIREQAAAQNSEPDEPF